MTSIVWQKALSCMRFGKYLRYQLFNRYSPSSVPRSYKCGNSVFTSKLTFYPVNTLRLLTSRHPKYRGVNVGIASLSVGLLFASCQSRDDTANGNGFFQCSYNVDMLPSIRYQITKSLPDVYYQCRFTYMYICTAQSAGARSWLTARRSLRAR